MPLELHVLSGARAGQRAAYDQPVVTVGRHPTCDFRFDPEQDREVSTRHAELRRQDARWVVADINSTNGTFVNGARVAGEAELHAGDVLAFGSTGPKVEVAITGAGAGAGRSSPGATRVSWGGRGSQPGVDGAASPPVPHGPLRASVPAAPAAAPAPALAPPALPRAPAAAAPTPTGVRIAAAVHESTRGLRQMLIGVSALLVLVVGGAVAYNQWQQSRYEARIAALVQEFQRAQATFDAQYRELGGRVASLDSAYSFERTRSEALRRQLSDAVARGSDAEVEVLRKRLADSQSKTRGIVAAAQMDPRKVNRLSGPAVVLIAVQQADGKSFSGSGFNVLPGGLVVTNRHVVHDPAGRPVKAVRVIFSGTRGAWLPARVVAVGTAKDDDLALLQLEVAGTYPTVAGITPSRKSVDVGAPVATIGFPLGTDLAGMQGDIDEITAAPTLTAGTVSKMLPSVVQIDSYSGQGASGSPLLDGDGHVVGVIYGGAPGSNGRIVYAVPSERLIALLPREAAALLR